MKPSIVIVGRPNVGKSTLFNRLVGKRRSLVHDFPGVTRDLIYEQMNLEAEGFKITAQLTDTGGWGGKVFPQEIEEQIEKSLTQSDFVLLVVDAQSGLQSLDREFLKFMRKKKYFSDLNLVLILNKCDDLASEKNFTDFYSLGVDHLFKISAEHGRGIEDLKQWLIENLKDKKRVASLDFFEENEHFSNAENKIPKIALIGKPNVGKSTLFNLLSESERSVVSPIAGTTVDIVDSVVYYKNEPFIFLDTAGIRRKSKTEKGVEVLSVLQTKKALEHADIALLVLDGEKGVTDQDEKIVSLIEKSGCSVVLVVNKWDTQKKNKDFTPKKAEKMIRAQMSFLEYAPILFLSAAENRGIDVLFPLVKKILRERKLRIETKVFTEWMRNASLAHNPQNAKFYYCHQSGSSPPSFLCYVNDSKKVHYSFHRYLVNSIRKKWGFLGSPVRLKFVKSKNSPRKEQMA